MNTTFSCLSIIRVCLRLRFLSADAARIYQAIFRYESFNPFEILKRNKKE